MFFLVMSIIMMLLFLTSVFLVVTHNHRISTRDYANMLCESFGGVCADDCSQLDLEGTYIAMKSHPCVSGQSCCVQLGAK